MDKLGVSQAWQTLKDHYSKVKHLRIREQFAGDSQRFSRFSLKAAGIFLDYSKNHVTQETLALLLKLAQAAGVASYRDQMFGGAKINTTEDRAVLHTALRNLQDQTTPIGKLVHETLSKVAKCVNDIRDGKWRGYTGKVITDVVNLGIGGSDLGPAMVVAALKSYENKPTVHFVSNVDATHLVETIKYLSPETTLFVIASKTFTTQETLANALSAREWLMSQAQVDFDVTERHFIAVTAKPDLAMEFGIHQDNILPMWDSVGGRFSLWSSIGVSIALAIGMPRFYELLQGAFAMDQHFRQAPPRENMPVILALLSIWNVNFLGANTQAIIPYDQYLHLFPAYLQQLAMESNGKSVNIFGQKIDYNTSPIIWGGVGTNSQHSFHQLLMQGTHKVPVDFIVALNSFNPIGNHHLLLYANCLAQSQALMCGRSEGEILDDLGDNTKKSNLVPHQVISGNVPSNTLVLNKIDPASLGALIALYEHKVFVEGVIWQINSFDQWGVELGKKIAKKLLPILQGEKTAQDLDSSTAGLISLIDGLK